MLNLCSALALAFAMIVATPAATPDTNPYAAEFADARASTDSEFQLRILEDDVITAEEYQSAIDAFLACAADAGYDTETERSLVLPQTYQFSWEYPDATPGVDVPQSVWDAYVAAVRPCELEFLTPIAGLYAAVVSFPNNEDVLDANLACLKADGLVPDDYTRSDIEHAAETGEWGEGVNAWTMEFSVCLKNPFKIGLEPQATPAASPAAISPYAAEFAAARNATDNPLQLGILSDDVITAEEYQQVVDAFLVCMADEGYEITLVPKPLNPALPLFDWTIPAGLTKTDAYDAAFDACAAEWKTEVEVLYGSILVNPQNRPWDEMYHDCLVRTGVVPESFTLKDYRMADMSGIWPDGVEIFSGAFAVCMANPANPLPLPLATPAPIATP